MKGCRHGKAVDANAIYNGAAYIASTDPWVTLKTCTTSSFTDHRHAVDSPSCALASCVRYHVNLMSPENSGDIVPDTISGWNFRCLMLGNPVRKTIPGGQVLWERTSEITIKLDHPKMTGDWMLIGFQSTMGSGRQRLLYVQLTEGLSVAIEEFSRAYERCGVAQTKTLLKACLLIESTMP